MMTELIECSQEEYVAYLKFVRLHHRLPFEGEDICEAPTRPTGKITKSSAPVQKLINDRIIAQQQGPKRIGRPKGEKNSPAVLIQEPIDQKPAKLVRPAAVYSNKSKEDLICDILNSDIK